MLECIFVIKYRINLQRKSSSLPGTGRRDSTGYIGWQGERIGIGCLVICCNISIVVLGDVSKYGSSDCGKLDIICSIT